MGQFTIVVGERSQKEVLAKLDKMSVAFKKALREAVISSSEVIAMDAKGFCPVNTGRLRASIRPLYYRGGLSSEVGTDVFYAPFVEFGTEPHWAPIEPLKYWAAQKMRRRKNANPDSLAYAAQKKIAREGNTPQPFLFPAYEVEKPNFVEKATEAITEELKRQFV